MLGFQGLKLVNANAVLTRTGAAHRDGDQRDLFRCVIGTRMLNRIVRIERNLHMKIAVTHVAHNHADEATRIGNSFGLGDAIRKARNRHAGVGRKGFFAGHEIHASPVDIVPRFPQFAAIFLLIGETIIAAAMICRDRFHLLDLLGYVSVGAVKFHEQRGLGIHVLELAVLDAGLHLHIIE